MKNRHSQPPKMRFITAFDPKLDEWEIKRATMTSVAVDDSTVTVECDIYIEMPVVPAVGWIIEDDQGRRARVREVCMNSWGDIAVILEAD